MGIRFWLRWSWRDLRPRASAIVAIATIIALGSGIAAGLASTSAWRRASLDATFRRLDAHDVRVSLVPGTSTDATGLAAAVRDAGGAAVGAISTRLVVRAPVSLTVDGRRVIAAGELLGTDLAAARRVDRWKVVAGRDLTASDHDAVVLDRHFALAHDLPPAGWLELGGRRIRYVGHVLSPELLTLTTTSGEAIQGQATRAVVIGPVALARGIAELPGAANDALVRVTSGGDPVAVAASLARALPASLPIAVTVTARQEEPSFRSLYDEVRSEQRIFDVFAALVLAGAAFAAFNLTKRVVESQRRGIGIAMSLGVPRRRIALRPMLLAIEITVLGVGFGVALGWAVALWVLSIIRTHQPLPFWVTPFDVGIFARSALVALLVPVAASAYPVWRAVRVEPVDALLPPHLRAGRHLLAHMFRRLHLPGTTLVQAPLRRILRAPARSLLTIGAVALIMAPLLAALGATDSAAKTLDRGAEALDGARGERLLVDLTTYQLEGSPVIESVRAAPLVGRAVPGLNIGGYLAGADSDIGVSISMVDLGDPLSAPSSIAALDLEPGGIVLSTKAARDAHVDVGDEVVLRHPRRTGVSFRFVESRIPVRAVHDTPYRFVAYMDRADQTLFGMEGLVNTLKVQPRSGASMDDLQRQVAGIPGVAAALPTSVLTSTMRDMLAVVSRLFVVLQVVIGLLAFLVAFNTSRISTDERAREHATMFAFGVRIRRVLGIGMAESVLLGALGVAVGIGLGSAVLQWILRTVFPAALPDLTVLAWTSPTSYALTIAIGLGAAAAAPLLEARRLRAMRLPDTLRYVE